MIADQRKYLLPSDEDSSMVSEQQVLYQPQAHQSQTRRNLTNSENVKLPTLGQPD